MRILRFFYLIFDAAFIDVCREHTHYPGYDVMNMTWADFWKLSK